MIAVFFKKYYSMEDNIHRKNLPRGISLENLIFSFNCVVPIFIIIFIGWFIRKTNIANEQVFKSINTIAFNFALPMLLFRDISRATFQSFFDVHLLVFAVTATCLSFVVTWICAEVFIKEKSSIGAFVQGSFRSNYAIIGLSLLRNIVGTENAAKGALIISSVVPIYNVFSVIVLTMRSNKKGSASIKKALINICKNPLIIAVVFGLPFSFFAIKVPTPIGISIDYMANLASPLALLVIGGTMNFEKMRGNLKLAVVASTIKLIILPCVFIPIALFMKFRGINLVVLFIMLGSPTAIASYIMAENMDSNPDLAANIVLLTSLISIFTFTFGIYLLKTYQLI